MYLTGKITEETFCDEDYYSFENLGKVAERFSPFASDFKLVPNVYTSKEELKAAAVEAKSTLDEHKKNDE